MANATVQARFYSTEGTTGESAEGGVKLNRAAGITATTAGVPIPNSTGTKYSWLKHFALHVTGASSPAQAITARTVVMTGALQTGLKLWFDPTSSHTVADGTNVPADSASDDDDPGAAYTEITTSAQTYHAASQSSGSTGRNGEFCVVVLGVASTFAGTSGTNVQIGTSDAARSVILGYDEM